MTYLGIYNGQFRQVNLLYSEPINFSVCTIDITHIHQHSFHNMYLKSFQFLENYLNV